MMERSTSTASDRHIVRQPRRQFVAGAEEVERLVELIRAEATRLGGPPPLIRRIRGSHWIAFDPRVLDEIASDPWYDERPLDEPFPVLHSGAVRTVKQRQDAALVKLARCIRPFTTLFDGNVRAA